MFKEALCRCARQAWLQNLPNDFECLAKVNTTWISRKSVKLPVFLNSRIFFRVMIRRFWSAEAIWLHPNLWERSTWAKFGVGWWCWAWYGSYIYTRGTCSLASFLGKIWTRPTESVTSPWTVSRPLRCCFSEAWRSLNLAVWLCNRCSQWVESEVLLHFISFRKLPKVCSYCWCTIDVFDSLWRCMMLGFRSGNGVCGPGSPGKLTERTWYSVFEAFCWGRLHHREYRPITFSNIAVATSAFLWAYRVAQSHLLCTQPHLLCTQPHLIHEINIWSRILSIKL